MGRSRKMILKMPKCREGKIEFIELSDVFMRKPKTFIIYGIYTLSGSEYKRIVIIVSLRYA